jgi:hypothetical protein
MPSGLDGHCVKKQCGFVGLCFRGRMALDIRLSRVCTGVAAMRQDYNYYQLDTMKLGRKKGWKIHTQKIITLNSKLRSWLSSPQNNWIKKYNTNGWRLPSGRGPLTLGAGTACQFMYILCNYFDNQCLDNIPKPLHLSGVDHNNLK